MLDVGPDSAEPVDYPDFAEAVGSAVIARYTAEERHVRRLAKLAALERRYSRTPP